MLLSYLYLFPCFSSLSPSPHIFLGGASSSSPSSSSSSSSSSWGGCSLRFSCIKPGYGNRSLLPSSQEWRMAAADFLVEDYT